MARWTGCTVESFELGVGPKLFATKRNGIQYCLRPIPLGGVCAIKEFAFFQNASSKIEARKQALKKMAIVIVGPIMSCVLAFLLMMCSQNIEGLKLVNVNAKILKDAGIQKGDVIRSINGTRVFHVDDVYYLLEEGKKNTFTIQNASRDRKEYEIFYEGEDLGISYDNSIRNKVNGTVNMFSDMLSIMTDAFLDTITGETNVVENMEAPEIKDKISMGVRYDVNKNIIVLSALSLSICFFNLLPIVMLDGFRFVVYFLEFLIGRNFGKVGLSVIGVLGIALSIVIIF